MNILFLGGDARMGYAADFLAASSAYEPRCLENSGDSRFPAIVLPVPLTKNGADIFAPLSPAPIPLERVVQFAEPRALILAGGECPRLSALCKAHSLSIVNYFADETLTLRNAALTAEAAVSLLVTNSDNALLGARVLITGFGRIARELSARLRAFGCECVIAARRRESRACAQLLGFSAITVEEIPARLTEFAFIVNTAPAPLFSEEDFARMSPDCVFLELASVPEQRPHNVRYIHGMGLPGKYSPKTAGRFIAEELLRYLK